MNKLTVAALAAGAVAAAGFVVSKIVKDKKKPASEDLYDEDYCNSCCGDCCEEDLDVVIPAEDTDDAVEDISVEVQDTAGESCEEAPAEEEETPR
ncbi:MAG: hypothetical protein LUD57_04865 [Ruminococcus sp.]|nr:hypothetical protein [Ruminococcus sp.]